MKKYLMIAVAGLAIASCNKMDGTMSQSELDQSKYNQAFLKYLGAPIAPNQTWGFSSDAYTRAAFTRAVPNITFPTFRDSSCPSMPTKYSNTVPGDAKYAKDYQNYQQGDVIYINTAYQELNQPQNTQDLTIYVDGNVTLKQGTNQNGNGTTICVTENSTLKLYSVSERLTVYLAPNATLDLSESYAQDWNDGGKWKKVENPTYTFTKDNAALYMSEGSKIVCPSELYFKDGYTVLNEGGTIDVNNLHVEKGAILYNKNKVKATGVIALRNDEGEIDNFGTMEGASMTLDANARFYNVAGGTVTISGLTKLNNDSGNNAWMNGGQFNTGSFEITGGCQDPAAFNNCHMTVTGKFFMNHGNFVLDGGAAVECGSFEWQSDNYFHMGGKALLKVTGQLLANNQNDSPQYGFWGDDTEYAVIEAGSIVKGSEGKCRAAYYGNLFIDTDSHFTQGESSADGTWYTFDESVKFSFTDNTDISGLTSSVKRKAQKATNFSIDIPADAAGCSPGYNWGDITPEYDIRIIAEDLSAEGASDFDFNDVVLDVKFGAKAQIRLTHAGGTLPLCIGTIDLDHEVHKLFGVWKGDFPTQDNATVEKQVMVNTGAGPDKTAVNVPLNVAIANAEEANTKLPLYVYKNGTWQEMTAPMREPACKLAVGTDYLVLRERTSIKGEYPLFVKWATDAKFTSKWW
jgi:hypothetical protein